MLQELQLVDHPQQVVKNNRHGKKAHTQIHTNMINSMVDVTSLERMVTVLNLWLICTFECVV